ncbi:RNA-binding protein Rsf1 [Trichinella papuae]|uniref:RNA-binding protein Rsf1 n=1 Tax=Trichinella papuae TaxID=268474 RepID=A0A0V1N2Q0_9BILA|nr:RNA-binding protein Rsf1 [Trichinella papuae]
MQVKKTMGDYNSDSEPEREYSEERRTSRVKEESSNRSRRRSRSASRSRSRSRSRGKRRGRSSSRSASRSRSRSGERNGSSRVHIGDIDDTITKADLEDAFSKFGKISEIWLATYAPFYAFIVYKTREDAEEAVHRLNGSYIRNCKVRVSLALPRRRYGPRSDWRPPPRGYSMRRNYDYGSGYYDSYDRRDYYDRRYEPRSSYRRTRSPYYDRYDRYSRTWLTDTGVAWLEIGLLVICDLVRRCNLVLLEGPAYCVIILFHRNSKICSYAIIRIAPPGPRRIIFGSRPLYKASRPSSR